MHCRSQAWRTMVLVLLLIAGCSGAADPDSSAGDRTDVAAPAAGTPVETQAVALGRVRATIVASGSVKARRVSEIGSEVPGRLIEVFVRAADEVEAGAPLFRIDPRSYEIALQEARAGLALARAESANARADAERSSKLADQRIVARQREAQVRTRAAVARARVEQMEARVARAEHDLGCTLVRAPYSGSIIERLAHEGAMAGGGPIVVLQESQALEAVIGIPEAAPAVVHPGDTARLLIEGMADPLEGTVGRVSDRIDPRSRTYLIRVPVRDPSRTVKAGSYVTAEIQPARGPERPVVSRSALLLRDGRSYAFRVVAGRARRIAVHVGRQNAARAEILAGLKAGDRVVVGEPVRRLSDGEDVVASAGVPEVSRAEAEEVTGR